MGSLLPLSCHRHPPSLHSPTPQRHSHLFEVTDGVLRPVDVADHPAGQLVRGGVVILREGQQQRQEPDHSHHHLGLRGRHALLQRMDDGHVPAAEEPAFTSSTLQENPLKPVLQSPKLEKHPKFLLQLLLRNQLQITFMAVV